MTIIETTNLLTLVNPDGSPFDVLEQVVCTDRSHVAVDRVCTTCAALHLPTMETVAYCDCLFPVLEVHGIAVWRCVGCDLPNKEALLGRLPVGKAHGTINPH